MPIVRNLTINTVKLGNNSVYHYLRKRKFLRTSFIVCLGNVVSIR